jgi:ABC-type uncharacterized transport system permease subunit
MALLVLAAVLLVGAASLDTFFRFRMMRIGSKGALLKGGFFDYKNYHEVRADHGWAAWPVYLMWGMYICGIGFLIAGFFISFGTHPTT